MGKRKRILLVDDESAITLNLTPILERAGYAVATASDGEEALRQITAFSPDLIVLDILMPRLDGRAALRQLRQQGDETPVILLTQVGEAAERAMALDEGADDYLNKPFAPYELLARMRAVLRRTQSGKRPLREFRYLLHDDLKLDRASRRAYHDGQELGLTPKAVALLEFLMTHPDELMTREQLLNAVWGWDYPTGTRTVDTRIAELRKAFGDNPTHPHVIGTVPSQGYYFIGSVRGSN